MTAKEMPLPDESEAGASAVEYGLLVVAIVGVIVLLAFVLGTMTSGQFSDTCNKIDQQMASANC